MDKKLLSFVIPCYRSQNTILKVVDEIERTVKTRDGYDYEIILVNDCSPDDVWSVIADLARRNSRVTAINLAKNTITAPATMSSLLTMTVRLPLMNCTSW